MLRHLLLLFSVIVFTQVVHAQTAEDSARPVVTDTLPRPETTVRIKPRVVVDTTSQVVDTAGAIVINPLDTVVEKNWQYVSRSIDGGIAFMQQLLMQHPYFGFASKPAIVHSGLKEFRGKEMLFYCLVGLLLFFALLKQAFPKYLSDVFRLLFRTTLKQKQIREQLIQSPLPSFLLNVLFVVSGGLYAAILLQHFDATPIDNFWILFAYSMIGLAVIYTGKFAGLKLSGWLFNVSEAADTYIFIVFIINKVLGIFLLPVVILLSFVQGPLFTLVLTLSWSGIGILLLYRVLFTYVSIRNQVKFNPFHFLLYIAAFEVAPLLLIYKALLFFFQ